MAVEVRVEPEDVRTQIGCNWSKWLRLAVRYNPNHFRIYQKKYPTPPFLTLPQSNPCYHSHYHWVASFVKSTAFHPFN